jgi:uncharacterized protein
MSKLYPFALILLICGTNCIRPKEFVQNKRGLDDGVYDSASLLGAEQKETILRLIQELENDVGSQIAVITIPKLNNESIEVYSLRTAEALSLGRNIYKDGVLITIAHQDRMMRIAVGDGLVRIVTNEIADRIVHDMMAPNFREGRFYEGIFTAVDTVKNLIRENRARIGQEL